MDKPQLRSDMKEVLEQVRKPEERSADLIKYYEKLVEDLDIDALAVYIPIDSECDILPLVERLWTEGKAVYVLEYPKTSEEFQLIPWHLTSNIVKMNGARLPLESERVTVDEVDVLLVPGLAFSEQGERLGRGAGFYDQVLEDFDGMSIGVCFKEQLLEELPCEEHDMSVDLVWAV
jgi:5-formyltetrahydrofolate cyclo-ligase